MKNTIFTQIQQQLVNNEIYGNDRILQFRGFYPENAIVWLVRNQKCFKVTKLNKIIRNGEKVYEVEYKDVNTACDFLQVAYDIASYKREKKLRKGYLSNEPVSTKFLNINDQFRAELDCPNWSNIEDETGYKECPYNNKGYDHISREDSQSFEHFCQFMGFKNYEDFESWNEYNHSLTDDEIDMLYNQFLEQYQAPDYSFKDEDESVDMLEEIFKLANEEDKELILN